MAGSGRIATLQNDDGALILLRAIAVAHQRGQRAQEVSLTVSILVAGLGLLSRPVAGAASSAVVVGTAWAVLYATLVVPWSNRYLRVSATLQEMFDVALFNLPWNQVAVGDPLSEDDVSRLSRRFRRNADRLRDYYLVADVRAPYDVLFCMEQNLAWGPRVRRRFANAVVALAVVWSAAGIALAIGAGSTVGMLVTHWFVPSLGMLLLCLDIFRAQVSISRERTRVVELLRATIDNPAAPALANDQTFTLFARQVQDVLFQLRRRQPRVPTWFFWRFHDNDLTDFRFKMRALEARFGDAAQAKP